MVRIRYVHMGLWTLPRFGAFFVLKGTAFRCFILEPVPDVPLVRLWGSIGTRIPIWDAAFTYHLVCNEDLLYRFSLLTILLGFSFLVNELQVAERMLPEYSQVILKSNISYPHRNWRSFYLKKMWTFNSVLEM